MSSFRLINLCAIAVYLFALNANAAPPSYNIQLGVASENFDSQQDTYTQLTGTVRYAKGQSRHSVLNFNADLYTRHYNDLDNNSSDGVLGEIIYSYIPGTGYTAPVYSLALRQEFERFENTAKNSSKTSLILANTRRLDDRVTLTAGLELSKESSDIREVTTGSIFLNTDLQISSKTITYFNFKLENESNDLNSTAMTAMSQTAFKDALSAHHEGDTTMPGPSLPTSSSNNGFNSTNLYLTAGINYVLTSYQSIDVSYEYNNYALEDSPDIQGNVISLDYFYKF